MPMSDKFQHQAKVRSFNMLPSGFKAMVHCGLQAGLMTLVTGFDTVLHRMFSACVGISWLIHGVLQDKKKAMTKNEQVVSVKDWASSDTWIA